MNELQLGLIGAGVMIVAGVMGYNAWQAARERRKLPRPMPVDDEAALRASQADHDSPFIDASRSPRRDPVFVKPKTGDGRVEPSFVVPPADEPVDLAADGAPPAALAEVTGLHEGRDASAPASDPAHAASRDAADANADTRAQQAAGATPMNGANLTAGVNGKAGAAPEAPGESGATSTAPADAPNGHARTDGRTEPQMGLPGSAAQANARRATPEPAAAQPQRIEPIAPAQTISAAPPGLVDPRIDCIVPLRPAAPMPGDKLIALAQRLRRAGSKPVYIDGRREGGSNWEALQAGHRYDELRAAVQLANRSGALNELEFSEFAVGVQHLADALDGSPELPDMMETVAMARELDGFAAQCDAQLSLNIMSDGAPWSANYVQAVASQDGLLLSRDGTRFVKLDTRQNPVFMLQFGDTNFLRDDLTYKGGNMITLLLDVPVADEDILPFRVMCDYAASLSQRIGARVVDDQRRPLPEASLQAIDKQLMSLYGKLDAAGLPAGSPAARRLFSQ